jgi:pyridinium-3,5-bisthiocarboxylic acid mononucleotide nickel chelatase
MKAHNDLVVLIDASPAGVSGDKFLGAFLDLGGKPGILRRVAKVVGETLPKARSPEIQIEKVERGEIGALQVIINPHDDTGRRKGTEILDAARKCIPELGLSQWGSEFVLATINTLLDAESKVHGHNPEEVELNELGSADTLIDILGVACLAESLGLASAEWWCSPVAVGAGTTRFSGRTYANPPPAVAEILRKHHFPMERGRENTELSTPTGTAIIVNLVSKYSTSHPSISPDSIGYGAGSKELDEVANVLRMTVGKSFEPHHSHDEIVVLESNLDDVSGEVIGRAAEKLMAFGARDVTITPVYMKKNRPGHLISVISAKQDAERLAEVLMAETGTLGVRELPVTRHISPRNTKQITVKLKGRDHLLRVKVSQDRKGRPLRGKLEYEDLKSLSDKTGLPVREIQSKAKTKLESLNL